MTSDEAETIIRIDHGNNMVYLFSTRRGWWNKANRLGMKLTRTTRDKRGGIIAKDYEATLASVSPNINMRKAKKANLEAGEAN